MKYERGRVFYKVETSYAGKPRIHEFTVVASGPTLTLMQRHDADFPRRSNTETLEQFFASTPSGATTEYVKRRAEALSRAQIEVVNCEERLVDALELLREYGGCQDVD